MTENQPENAPAVPAVTPPPAAVHRPGDVVNGHVLGHDNVWRPLQVAAPRRRRRGGWILAAALLTPIALLYVLGLIVGGHHQPTEPTPVTTSADDCDDLTAEMLTMTGVHATEPYDLERVRQINHDRDVLGCWED